MGGKHVFETVESRSFRPSLAAVPVPRLGRKSVYDQRVLHPFNEAMLTSSR